MNTDYKLPNDVYNAALIYLWSGGINPGRSLLPGPKHEPNKALNKEVMEKAINNMPEEYIKKNGAILLKYILDVTTTSKGSE